MNAYYQRYGKIHFDEFDTLENCINFLVPSKENSFLFPLGIHDVENNILHLYKEQNVLSHSDSEIVHDILNDFYKIGIEPSKIVFL